MPVETDGSKANPNPREPIAVPVNANNNVRSFVVYAFRTAKSEYTKNGMLNPIRNVSHLVNLSIIFFSESISVICNLK